MLDDKKYIQEAFLEAKKSLEEGGIPIGAVLVKDNKIIGRGHNRLIQRESVILHGEMDCFENAGRLKGDDYQKCVLYTTLAPCPMCCGTILLYKIPKIVIGESSNLKGSEQLLIKNGVETRTHEGAKQQFGLIFIKSGKLERKYGKLYSKLADYRQKGDYGDLFDFDEEIVVPLIKDVEEFIHVIEDQI